MANWEELSEAERQVRSAVALDVELRAAEAKLRPSVIYGPRLYRGSGLDGAPEWIAYLGDPLVGCVGRGASPEEAMAAFDAAWVAKE